MPQDIDIQKDNKVVEIDIFDLFGYYRKKILWIVGSFIAGALLAGLVTHFLITPKYTATTTMYMVSSSSGSVVDLTDLNIGKSLSSDYIELVKTRPIVESMIKELNLKDDYEEALEKIEISAVADTRILKISVTDRDRRKATDMVNVLTLTAEKKLPKLMGAPKPNIAETATVPVKRSFPSMTVNVMIGAILLLVLTLAVLTVMHVMDDTLKTAEDIERNFGVLPLTVIPEGRTDDFTTPDSITGKRSGAGLFALGGRKRDGE